MQIFYNKVQALSVEGSDKIQDVKHLIEVRTGLPACGQRLIHSGRELDEAQTVTSSGLEAGSTMQLVFRLRGGKGGFGSLLRSAGRAALTDNTDACRDLSGRRMRHVNADRKLAEWAAQARERELEKAAVKQLCEQERAAQQEAEQQVDMDDVKVAQDAALANVMSAVESALASAPAKRASEPAQPSMPSSKRRKASNHMLDLDGDLSSDSDEDPELEPEAATTADNADSSKQRPADGGSAKDSTVAASVPASGSSGSEQEALVRSLHPCTVVQEQAHLVGDVAAAPSLGANASAPGTAALGSTMTASATSAALPTDASVTAAQAYAGVQEDSKTAPHAEKTWEWVDLSQYKSAGDVEALGLDHLRAELQRHGLKCGGSLAERAARLFLLSHSRLEKLDRKQFAKAAKK